MLRSSLLVGFFTMLLVAAAAGQSTEPVPAPPDVFLELQIAASSNRFPLGDLIPIQYSYWSSTPGKYFYVNGGVPLEGMRSLEISCSPPVESARRVIGMSIVKPESGSSFWEMLLAPCGGVGGGIGRGIGRCFDCNSEIPLTTTKLTFGKIPLNSYVRFRIAGVYSCHADAAEITATPQGAENRYALLVRSEPIVLRIVNDPIWSKAAANAYSQAFAARCQGANAKSERFLECSDLAQRITYLDTRDSLAAEVRFFDGREHGWDPGFWRAITTSSYPEDAVRLMRARIQEPDFEVSADLLVQLASMSMRLKAPEAFETDDPNGYHLTAVEIMRDYVRLLGNSLAKKNPDVLEKSVKSYRTLAEQENCEQEPLLSAEERSSTLSNVPQH